MIHDQTTHISQESFHTTKNDLATVLTGFELNVFKNLKSFYSYL